MSSDTPPRDPGDPASDLQRQFRDMLRESRAALGLHVPAADPPPEEPAVERDARERALQRIRTFNLKPREIRDYLDRFVIRQDQAKKVLSVAFCDHFNHVRQCLDNPRLQEQDYAKPNIALLGPTGVGKTYLMRCIARLIGVPFVKADATKFSETGYVGHDVEDLVRDLVRIAGGDVELARYGIIYVDEIDKIASTRTGVGRDVSGRGVQINLLKLMEETDVNLQSQTDLLSQMEAILDLQRGRRRPRTLSTRHILFIVSGAFDDLPAIVKRRIGRSPIGFAATSAAEPTDTAILNMAQTGDFIEYGFEPEFVGRLPTRIACEALGADDLRDILLHAEGSFLEQYRRDFQGYDMTFTITDEAVGEIARRAHRERTGARGLLTVLERVFRDFKFELPSTSIRSFEVTGETVADPDGALRALLVRNRAAQRHVLRSEIDRFTERFRQEHGLAIAFDEAAVEAIVELSLASDKTVRAICEDKLRDFEHGLKLVARNTGRSRFVVTRAAVDNPDGELSRWIVESFRQRQTADGGTA